MRPRLQDRGDRADAMSARWPMPPLQCGHGSKTVEMRKAAEKSLLDMVLQCGHGSKTVEIAVRRRAPGSAGRASMRPRLQDRGDRQPSPWHLWPLSRFNAATAPRPWRSSSLEIVYFTREIGRAHV